MRDRASPWHEYLGGGGDVLNPGPMDLPRRGVAPGEVDAAAVAIGGTGPVVVGGVVQVGAGLGGPLWRGRGGRADTVIGRGGGASLVVGEVVGLSAWWVVLPSHALVLCVHGGFWPLWGTVLGSGSAGGGGSEGCGGL